MTPLNAIVGSSAVPVNTGDFLQILLTYNLQVDTTLELRALILAENGTLERYSELITVLAAATTATHNYPLQNGLLLMASIATGDPTVLNGLLYAAINVLSGSVDTEANKLHLTAGYVSDSAFLAFPFSTPSAPSASGSPAQAIGSAGPAAGSDLAVVLAIGSPATLTGFTTQLNASAAVATRRVLFNFTLAGGPVIPSRSRTDQAASQQVKYIGWRGSGMPIDDTDNLHFYIAIPDAATGIPIEIDTITDNIDAADQWIGLQAIYTQSIAF